MEMEKAAAEFRVAVRRAGPRGAGRRYPPALRRMAVEYFQRRRTAGTTLAAISRELGVKRHTLVGWTACTAIGRMPPERAARRTAAAWTVVVLGQTPAPRILGQAVVGWSLSPVNDRQTVRSAGTPVLSAALVAS